MAFNINTFKAKTNLGFLKPSNFLTYIYPAIWAKQQTDVSEVDIAYLTSTASLPGVQILSQESRLYGAGPIVKMPYDIGVTDITMQFYVDARAASLNYFYDWVRNVVNLSHDQGQIRSGAYSNQIAYRSWYTTTIDIMLFNDRPSGDPSSPQDAALIMYTLYDAYPLSIAEPALSWQSGNEIMSFNVTFSYRSFEKQIISPPAAPGEGTREIPIPPQIEFEPSQPIPPPEGFTPPDNGRPSASSSKEWSPGTGSLPKYNTGAARKAPPLSAEKPQSGSNVGKVSTGLQAVNKKAQSIRESAINIRQQAVSKTNDVRKSIMGSDVIQTSVNILNTANEVKKTVGTVKQLNNSLKKNLIQDLKGQVKGGIPGL